MKKSTAIYLFLVLLSFLLSIGIAYNRLDWTSDKRYTLSEASYQVLESVDEPIYVEVYLEGDFPAKFQQFKIEIQSMLDEFQSINSKIEYEFIDPIEEGYSLDTLAMMGITPNILPEEREGKITQLKIFPYAFVSHKNRGLVVPLLSGKKAEMEQVLKASQEELEYHFIESFYSLKEENIKNVVFLNNHQSLKPIELAGLYQLLSKKYNVEPLFHVDSTNSRLELSQLEALQQAHLLMIAKPREPYEEEEKQVLDQYIMNGGKVLWMVDDVNAERDSLMRSGKITAFPVNLNINDITFAYGVRLKGGLVKDYQRAAKLKVASGEVQGNTQFSFVSWPYLPLGMVQSGSPITKNLNPVLFEFPSPIDTLENGIQKTVLYNSSPISDVQTTPSFVYLDDIVEATSDSLLNPSLHNGNQIMAVLLEGQFKSAYAGRFESSEIPNFKDKSESNKMIFISDGDIGKNDVMQGQYPVPLGVDALTNIQYDNGPFLENCVDYLLDDFGLMELRNRVINQRLLDEQKVLAQKSKWKNFNLFIPIAIIMLCMGIGIFLKNKSFK